MFSNIRQFPEITTGGGKNHYTKTILSAALVCCLSFNIPAFSDENYKTDYGDGNDTLYFKWVQDDKRNYSLEETKNKSEAQ